MRIICNECGKSCTSEVPDGTIVRAYVLCPECLETVPDKIANKFFESIKPDKELSNDD